jgi:hypothetical protein
MYHPHLTAMDGGNVENAGAIFGRLRHLLPPAEEEKAVMQNKNGFPLARE